MRIIRAVITGRVQGVGYRAWTQREAVARDLAGWVRNRQDGSVEAVFAGDPDPVAAMAESLLRGPHGSRVTGVEIRDADRSSLNATFGVRFVTLPTL
ncbi:MAG: acylphosphatase [Hyphomicrobiales bacterium]|nr:acylphosphatase [Hyphomicrobiales bacterium]